MKELYLQWSGGELKQELVRQARWTESIATGSESYIERVKQQLGLISRKKQVSQDEEDTMIQEPDSAYNVHFYAKKGRLSQENSIYFDESHCV